MSKINVLATKVALSMVMVGSLTMAGAGAAGAAGATTPTGTPAVSHSGSAGRQTLCTLHQRHMAFAIKNQARFATTTAKFATLADKARKAGHAKLAAHWDSVVAHRTTAEAHAKAKLAARSSGFGHRSGTAGRTC